jgi:hypothetical protein
MHQNEASNRAMIKRSIPSIQPNAVFTVVLTLMFISPFLGAVMAQDAVQGWKLVRTPGPDRTEIVSTMRTADLMQSDAEFAGMMVRCRPKSGLQIAFAVITPLHPRSHPKITLTVNASPMRFDGEVIPPGSLVALPGEAEVLARGAWQSAKELAIDIDGDGGKIHGVVPLENLSAAVAQLQASCPQ